LFGKIKSGVPGIPFGRKRQPRRPFFAISAARRFSVVLLATERMARIVSLRIAEGGLKAGSVTGDTGGELIPPHLKLQRIH